MKGSVEGDDEFFLFNWILAFVDDKYSTHKTYCNDKEKAFSQVNDILAQINFRENFSIL